MIDEIDMNRKRIRNFKNSIHRTKLYVPTTVLIFNQKAEGSDCQNLFAEIRFFLHSQEIIRERNYSIN